MPCLEREVTFYSDGSRMAGVLFEPAERERPGPGVVMCHGTNGVGRTSRFPQTGRTFAEAGYTSLIFDYRGYGESVGIQDRLWPEEQVDDILNALNFLGTQPDVDPQRLGLVGTSFGGGHVVRVAAVDQRVKAVISIVGVSNGERWLRSLRRLSEWREFLRLLEEDRRQRVQTGRSRVVSPDEMRPPDAASHWARDHFHDLSPEATPPARPARVTLESVEKVMAYRPEDYAHLISPRAALFIHSRDDTLVSPEESRAMYERAGEPKELVLVPGHHYTPYLPPCTRR